MRRGLPFAALFASLIALMPAMLSAQDVASSMYGGLHWRFIGPLRGGRTVAVSGVAQNPNLFYIAAVNGGIWKSDDAGRTWNPIFDAEQTGSIGALAVAPSDPRIIYAGSGEGLQRPDLAVGDGIYKSTDAGATWTHLGLRDGQQIASMAVDPRDPNRLFVAVLGHPYGPNSERGIFRSTDGGATFTRVLYLNDDVGGFEVKIDPQNPSIVYATMWAARQAPWEIGGSFEIAGSGVYKSTDGGATFSQLRNGLPSPMGRSEIAISPSNPQIVYTYVDVEKDGDDDGALYRSDDAGAHFVKVNDQDNIAERGDDLISIAVDPKDPQTLYLTNTSTYRTTDGGKTLVPIKGAPGGDDYHSIWINPNDPRILILGSDQGATITVNGARTWSSWYNQPTAQMYHVNADDRFPYWVCGGQQESGSACVVSRGNWGEITQRDWHTAGAEEYGYVVPDPLHPGIFYGGKVQKFEERTGQTQDVLPFPLRSKAYRAVRTEPIAFDPLERSLMYFGSNVLWATRDGGHSWRVVSPDLTRPNPGVPAVLGAFESDDPQHGTHRGVIYAIALSYRHHGTIWAGTDDGLVWITRDGGAHWSNITPPALTPWSKISRINVSRFDDQTAYIAVNRFRLDDLNPYVYVTHDGGAHWDAIVNGLPKQPVNAVIEDPVASNLLFAATENGVSVSFDRGAHWQSLQLDLPHTSVRDIIVHRDDVVVATHGRGFYILDDVEPLRELAGGLHVQTGAHLFTPATAYRVRRDTNTDTPLPPEEPSGENPPDGAIIDYALATTAQHVSIAIVDASGHTVREYSSSDVAPPPIPSLDKPAYWERPFIAPPVSAGMHRWVWDVREPPPACIIQDLPISAIEENTPRIPEGPLVPPGSYTVRLDVDGQVQTQTLRIVMDPRVMIAPWALQQQYAIAHKLATLMDRSYARMTAAKAAHNDKLAGRAADLNEKLAGLLDVVDAADAPVTTQALDASNALSQAFEQLK